MPITDTYGVRAINFSYSTIAEAWDWATSDNGLGGRPGPSQAPAQTPCGNYMH